MLHLARSREHKQRPNPENTSKGPIDQPPALVKKCCHHVGNRESHRRHPAQSGLRSGGQMQLANRGPTLADTAAPPRHT